MIRRNAGKIFAGAISLTGLGFYYTDMTMKKLERELLENPKETRRLVDNLNFSPEAFDPILDLRENLIKKSKERLANMKLGGQVDQLQPDGAEFVEVMEEYEQKKDETTEKLYNRLGLTSPEFGLKIGYIKVHNPDLIQEVEKISSMIFDYAFNGDTQSLETAFSHLQLDQNEIIGNQELAKVWNKMVIERNVRCIEKIENHFLKGNLKEFAKGQAPLVMMKECDLDCPVLELRRQLYSVDFGVETKAVYHPVVHFFASRRVYEESEEEDNVEFMDFYQDDLTRGVIASRDLAGLREARDQFLEKSRKFL